METEFNAKLEMWQARLADSNNHYHTEIMDAREAKYNGDHSLKPMVVNDRKGKKTSHVRNIIFENIESEVSSSIPMPKVTARHMEDEKLAAIVEHFLRNEIDRLPFEMMNDMAERTVPIQGGALWMVEWDNTKSTHNTVGEISVTLIHPKQLAPQPGIYTGINDMDWVIVKHPTTKKTVERKYKVSVTDESESEPDVRGSGAEETADDAVTEYIGFEKNDEGGINRYVWVNNIELEDLENYQARRQPVCRHCGKVRPLPGQVIGYKVAPEKVPTEDDMAATATRMLAENMAEESMNGGDGTQAAAIVPEEPKEPTTYQNGPCPWCGAEDWTTEEQDFEQVMLPITNIQGLQVPGMTPGFDETGVPVLKPTMVPFYRPDQFPLILQRNVSVYGQLLGNSDVDATADQQDTSNRLEQKIIDRLMKAGTRITLPDRADIRTDPEDGERIYLKNPADRQSIGVYQFSGDLSYEMTYLNQVYQEARQTLGITNSFQGREDSTATSGVAKQFSAAQSAGRLESKRTMKNAAYADLYQLMFKFALAYGDEPRTVTFKDNKGNTMYEEFNRYDFLKQDESGEYYWNDQFLFSIDSSDTLANNRANMWTETRNNLASGAFGDPSSTETLLLYWSKMEELHYPGAASTKEYLEERLNREQMQAAAMQQAQAMQSGAPAMQGQAMG